MAIQPIKVSEKLYRGARPETLHDLQKLRALGITSLISLETGAYELFHSDYYETKEEYYLKHFVKHELKCSNVKPPTKEQQEKFLQLVSAGGRKHYVHCRFGVDRTGFMVAKYRMKIQNWPKAKAIEEMVRLGFHKIYFYWKWFL